MPKPTIRAVAEKAGVSLAAVSIAMNGKPGISEETRQNILKIAAELGYRSARAAAPAGKGFTVFVTSENDGYHRHAVVDALIDAALQSEALFHIYSEAQLEQNPQLLSGCSLLITFDTMSRERLEYFAGLAERVLVLNGDYPRAPFFNLRFDYAGAAYDLTRHLVSLGHRSFIYYNRDLPLSKSLLCFNGFQKTVLEYRLPFDSKQLVMEERSTPNVMNHLRDIIQSTNVSAVVCTSVGAAYQLMDTLSKLGYRVPQDISVAALTHTVPAKTSGFRFTCICLSSEQFRARLTELCSNPGLLQTDSTDCLIEPGPVLSGSSVSAPKYDPSSKKIGFAFIHKDHPTMRIVRAGFMGMCTHLGYQPEIRAIDEEQEDALCAACKALSESGISGAVLWTPYPKPVHYFREKNIPVVCIHSLTRDTPNSGWTALIAADPQKNAAVAAERFALSLRDKTGRISVSQSTSNNLEDMITQAFTRIMRELCPGITITRDLYIHDHSEEAMEEAKNLIRATPELLGVFSTCGTAGVTWAMAKKDLGRDDIQVIGTDYDEESLRLLKDGSIDALVGQPVYEEAQDGVRLLDSILRGGVAPAFKTLDVPLITAADPEKYERQINYVNNWYA